MEQAMFTKAPKRSWLWIWIRRGLLTSIAGLLALGLSGMTYQTLATRIDRRSHPAPGTLIDVGGHHLHMHCLGQGTPTVILEAANLGFSANWVRVQQRIARTTRVCAYDRAGMGWSESGPAPRDPLRISTELHTLLARAGTPGPYVLVGHSYGGLYVQMYAARYADQVAGIVLVDSSHPDQFTQTEEGRRAYTQIKRQATIFPLLARLGIPRMFKLLPADPTIPGRQRKQIEAFNCSTEPIDAAAAELRAMPQVSIQLRNTQGLGNKPLAVLTATSQQPPSWSALQEKLTELVPHSTHLIVEGATHTSLLNDQRHSKATSAAIEQVVSVARSNSKPPR
jgi:pimeloyl-ACP methyl ester carboxylesterase